MQSYNISYLDFKTEHITPKDAKAVADTLVNILGLAGALPGDQTLESLLTLSGSELFKYARDVIGNRGFWDSMPDSRTVQGLFGPYELTKDGLKGDLMNLLGEDEIADEQPEA